MKVSMSWWRYRWHGLILAWCIALPAWAAVAMLPDRYEASAQLYVRANSAMELLRSRLPAERTGLTALDLVRETTLDAQDLDDVIRAAGSPRGTGIDDLLERIEIRTASQWDNLFRISYEDTNRRTALAVVEAFVATVVEQAAGFGGADDQNGYDEERVEATPSVRIIEAAEVRAVPALPNGALWVCAILAIGLAAGAAFVCLLQARRPVFDAAEELTTIGDLPVVGVVRHARMNEAQARRRHEFVTFGMGTGALLLCFAVALLI